MLCEGMGRCLRPPSAGQPLAKPITWRDPRPRVCVLPGPGRRRPRSLVRPSTWSKESSAHPSHWRRCAPRSPQGSGCMDCPTTLPFHIECYHGQGASRQPAPLCGRTSDPDAMRASNGRPASRPTGSAGTAASAIPRSPDSLRKPPARGQRGRRSLRAPKPYRAPRAYAQEQTFWAATRGCFHVLEHRGVASACCDSVAIVKPVPSPACRE